MLQDFTAVVFPEKKSELKSMYTNWQVFSPAFFDESGELALISTESVVYSSGTIGRISKTIHGKKKRVVFFGDDLFPTLNTYLSAVESDKNPEKDIPERGFSSSIQENLTITEIAQIGKGIKNLIKETNDMLPDEMQTCSANFGGFVQHKFGEMYTIFVVHNMYLVNWTQQVFIDMSSYVERNLKEDQYPNPLPLLTACGHKKLYTKDIDYTGINANLVGDWAFDLISYEDEKPPIEFDEFIIDFTIDF